MPPAAFTSSRHSSYPICPAFTPPESGPVSDRLQPMRIGCAWARPEVQRAGAVTPAEAAVIRVVNRLLVIVIGFLLRARLVGGSLSFLSPTLMVRGWPPLS